MNAWEKFHNPNNLFTAMSIEVLVITKIFYELQKRKDYSWICRLYSSDDADDQLCVALGGRWINKTKKKSEKK